MEKQSPSNFLTKLFGLHGKTAVVIGGTGVLGGAICDALAAAGAYLYVVGRNAEAGQAVVDRWPEQAKFFQADATSADDLLSLTEDLKSNDKSCDILVNGAGTNSATPFFEISDEEWDRIFRVNLSGLRVACQVLGKFMIDQKTQGSIINIASMSALKPLSRVFTYSASKAAVLNLTENLAREFAPLGIRVNAISPGFFPAEQNRKVLTPSRVESIMGHTPMNRFGSPEELAGAVLLAASNQAGSFVTGANLIVDGGFNAMTI
ncbi:putative oxidoreductase UxuB [Thalassoglobus neptunius]|uniref:Putative oxidoreductase UxuB n=1 Tax=Thalassoglobus neptunius TaxID=1938619 RepID=A0A5C5W9G6_9PLAN|nr:SDR family oxidoreductase [Thalassoglobus neptunius]TWT47137.1 putative oxidoreductase UxuB [Thalassoglobus neptunius]